jgi:hypothetical protein
VRREALGVNGLCDTDRFVKTIMKKILKTGSTGNPAEKTALQR